MILDRYFARRFLAQVAIIMIVFLTLLFLIELIEQVRRFSESDVTLAQILYLVSLNIPAAMSTILPLIIILSALVGAVSGIAMILFAGRDSQRPMPFGPFLAAAGLVAMLWGPELVTGYRQIAGL